MDISWAKCYVIVFFLVLVQQSADLIISGQPFDYPTANLSTSWINGPSLPHSVRFNDGSMVRPILLRGTLGPRFACGFFCNGACQFYLFAIFIVQTNSISLITLPASGFPQIVWSANRNNPVTINATLQLTSDGDLVLKDADGSTAWSTNTAGKFVSGLNLTDMGNLVLFDHNNVTVWQSFDHPTDSLVPGQRLWSGKKLTPSVSPTNWTELGLLSLSITNQGLIASIESSPPQMYFNFTGYGTKMNKEPTYVNFLNGSLALFFNSTEASKPDKFIFVPNASSAQYMRFGPDGHLRVYEWTSLGWSVVSDLFTWYVGACAYPTVCGNYGICFNGQCSCPSSTSNGTTYFKQMNDGYPDLGCYEITPLSCEASEYHSFVELMDTRYFTFNHDLENADLDSCKLACLKNCSCKAAIFQYGSDSATSYCYLPSQIFSLMNNDKVSYYNSTVFVKVQNVPTAVPKGKKKSKVPIILVSSLGSFFGLLLLIGILVWKNRDADEAEEGYLDHVPGMLTRFSYKDLEAMTENFNKVLGEGGFGSVFEGTLIDGTKIAVKRLNGAVQVKKSFLAEVESIGSIHHLNLVRLLGFCANKSHRLLVYEYMSNGSLEKWIFHKTHEFVLDWKQRKKIILDIAKGLTYLHEECRQKIFHLDIKPQNILLDDNFSAKISDFGLAKLIDRDQSQIVTTMRGTPGYLAPEWLNSVITEKLDIYSFGVVVLEILCGRRNFDPSQHEDRRHLVKVFEKQEYEDRLLDLVDNPSDDLQFHKPEILKMMRMAVWCLQNDYTKRPSMSVVVKVLEGVMEVEHNLDYALSNPPSKRTFTEFTPLLPVVLSGPR